MAVVGAVAGVVVLAVVVVLLVAASRPGTIDIERTISIDAKPGDVLRTGRRPAPLARLAAGR